MRYSHLLALVLLALGAQFAAAAPPAAGTVFRDCEHCPEMAVIGPGSFTMGAAREPREGPEHEVTIAYAFAVGRTEVTIDEWSACAADKGCYGYRPSDQGWGGGTRPVINVSWDDAQSYVTWLSQKTGHHYRLLSEAEYEYVARAGTTTSFWWGDSVGVGNANCDGCGTKWDNKQTAPVGSFRANPFGLFDMAGNVTEWVEDRWNSTYNGAPTDGSAWETGDPLRRVLRGGSWYNSPKYSHSAYRNGDSPRFRNKKIGFRVAETL